MNAMFAVPDPMKPTRQRVSSRIAANRRASSQRVPEAKQVEFRVKGSTAERGSCKVNQKKVDNFFDKFLADLPDLVKRGPDGKKLEWIWPKILVSWQDFCKYTEKYFQGDPMISYILNGKEISGIYGAGAYGAVLQYCEKGKPDACFALKIMNADNLHVTLKGMKSEASFQCKAASTGLAPTIYRKTDCPDVVHTGTFTFILPQKVTRRAYILIMDPIQMDLKTALAEKHILKADTLALRLKQTLEFIKKKALSKIVHGDMHTENIVFLEEGKMGLIDFGMARTEEGGWEQALDFIPWIGSLMNMVLPALQKDVFAKDAADAVQEYADILRYLCNAFFGTEFKDLKKFVWKATFVEASGIKPNFGGGFAYNVGKWGNQPAVGLQSERHGSWSASTVIYPTQNGYFRSSTSLQPKNIFKRMHGMDYGLCDFLIKEIPKRSSIKLTDIINLIGRYNTEKKPQADMEVEQEDVPMADVPRFGMMDVEEKKVAKPSTRSSKRIQKRQIPFRVMNDQEFQNALTDLKEEEKPMPRGNLQAMLDQMDQEAKRKPAAPSRPRLRNTPQLVSRLSKYPPPQAIDFLP